MPDIELVIKMPEEKYNYVKKQVAEGIDNPLKVYIANGTPIPDNAISREKILKMTKAMYLEIANMVLDDDVTTKEDIVSYVASKCRQFIDNKVRDLPPVNLQPKTGRWIYVGNSEVSGLKICKCSNCEKKTYGSHKYCPNCGAKMVEPQESEDKE